MYNEHIIDSIKEFLNKQLGNIIEQIDGERSFYQGYLHGCKSVIDYVLGSIDIGKDDK